MHYLSRLFLAVFLVLAGTALFAGNAPAAQKPSALETEYRKTAEDWRTLLRNDRKAALRDPWLAIEKRFLAIAAKDPKGNVGAKGLYQAGRSREELAERSFLDSDWRQAFTHYRDIARKYPTHSLADDGLYHAADIAAKRLKKPEEAREAAQAVLDRYPRGDMAKKARELLATLPSKGGKKPASGSGGKKPQAVQAAQSGQVGKPAREQGRPSTRRGTQPGAQVGTLVEQLGLTIKTIMIDAGHGGRDPGAMGNGITEKETTLNLAKMLGQRLQKQGFTVLFTRQSDSFVALDQRAVLSNNKKADLFISLHVNSSTDKKINGVETYFLDLARTSSAATVAARENAISVKNISDLQFILTDLMLTSKLQESRDLAATLHKGMYARLTQAGFTMNDNGVRSAPFYVLMGARMPAVLVEVGYLSHAEDSRRIKNRKYLERLADGIAQGVAAYKNKLAQFSKR